MERSFDASLDWLRSDIEKSNFTSAQSLQKNVRAHTTNALQWIVDDPACHRLRQAVVDACDRLAHEMEDTFTVATNNSALEASRQNAISALEQFRRHLAGRGPSDTARALGVD